MGRAPQTAKDSEKLQQIRELRALMKTAVQTLEGDRDTVPVHVLRAVQSAITAVLAPAYQAPPEVRDWEPKPGEIWRREKTGHSAWDHFNTVFAVQPYSERPFAHQLRQNKAMKRFYDAINVHVGNNKRRNKKPDTLSDLFPIHPQARGGHLSARTRG